MIRCIVYRMLIGLLASLIVVAALLAYWAYSESRDADEGLGQLHVQGAFAAGLIVAFAVVMVAYPLYRMTDQIPRRRLIEVIAIFTGLLPVCGIFAGKLCWDLEFRANRKAAESVIARVNEYHQQRAEYPSSLNEIENLEVPVIQRVATSTS